MMSDHDPLIAYTDGGCRPNPGPGGWGVVLLRPGAEPEELSGSEPEATNNRMELRAALEALRAARGAPRLRVVTDSEYLRRGVTEWMERWRRNGWKTASGSPVQNRDLWEALDAELARHDVEWRWTRGHAGDEWNERADRLASAAIPRPPLPVDDPGAVHAWLAVAWSGKQGRGAWSALLEWEEHERTVDGEVAGGSANRAHLESAVGALEALTRPARVHVYTTSDYLKDGATTWVHGWRSRGWTTRDGKPVSHRDLWQTLDRLQQRYRVTWHVLERDADVEQYDAVKRRAKAVLKGEVA